jgi:hypothetical protein
LRSGFAQLGGCIPGQQLINPIDRMLSDVREHVSQVGFRVDVVQLSGADERVDRCDALTAVIGACK